METGSKEPLVSVVIPTYNREGMVGQAIDSVLCQDFSDFELIVVDDGSTDKTPDLLRSYGERIRIIRQPNRGVSAARNAGIRAAAGSLIALLDSDDEWLPGKLKTQIEFFKSHPEALICQTEEIWIRNGQRVNPKKRHKKPSGWIFTPSLELCLVSPSAVMMRGELFDRVGFFDEDLPACEDYDLWLRVSCRYPVYLIDESLIIKRGGHADQLSKMSALDRYRIEGLVKILGRRALPQDLQEAAINVLQRKCKIYMAGCLKRGRFAEASRYENLLEAYPE